MKTNAEFEREAKALRGECIAKVRYFELYYWTDEPNWSRSPSFDLLDHGLELETATGRVFRATWGWEFTSYGISFREGRMEDALSCDNKVLKGEDLKDSLPTPELVAPVVWDVTAESRWATLLHCTVSDVKVYWDWQENRDGSRTYFPQDIEIDFESGRRVLLSAVVYLPESGTFVGRGDEVAVFFDEETAQRHKIGPYSSEEDLGWRLSPRTG